MSSLHFPQHTVLNTVHHCWASLWSWLWAVLGCASASATVAMIAVGVGGHSSHVGISFPWKRGTIGGKMHGMTPSGRLEGFAEGFGAEGWVMVCAAGGFIRFPFCSLTGNFGGGETLGSQPILVYISTDQNLPRSYTSQVGKFALPGCKLGRGLCADVVEGRICWISTNTICRLGSDECSVWETTHFAYIRTSGIAKICRTYLVFSNNYWWVANICYFSPEQCINYGTETTGHTHVRPETLCSKLLTPIYLPFKYKDKEERDI